jgi:DNA-binding CsgD family transcriptional regulator
MLTTANGNRSPHEKALPAKDVFNLASGISSDIAEAMDGQDAESFLLILERIGVGYLTLDEQRKVIDWNIAAQMALERQGDRAGDAAELSGAFRSLASGLSVQFKPNSVFWLVIPSRFAKPLVIAEPKRYAFNGKSIVVLIDRDARQRPNPHTLQKMFGLTNAETQLALSMASGDTPLEIARNRRLSRTTIRSQLAALFAKTETKRQAELVSLLCRMAVLP